MQVSRQYILINEYDYEFHSCCWAKVDLSLIQVTWSQRCQDHRDEIQYVWDIIKMRVGSWEELFFWVWTLLFNLDSEFKLLFL